MWSQIANLWYQDTAWHKAYTLLHIFCLQKQAQMYTNTHTRIHAVKIIFITKKDYLTTSFNLSGSYKKQSGE